MLPLYEILSARERGSEQGDALNRLMAWKGSLALSKGSLWKNDRDAYTMPARHNAGIMLVVANDQSSSSFVFSRGLDLGPIDGAESVKKIHSTD
jgi:hypothetical protein